MKRVFLFFSGLFFVSAATAQGVSNHEAAAFPVLHRHYYSINYPASWLVDSSGFLGGDVFIKSPKQDSLDRFSENVNVFVQDLKGKGYDLLRMGNESEEQIRNMVNDAVIVESRLDTAASTPCYRLSFKGQQGKFSLLTIQRYYLKEDIGIAVTFTMEATKEEQFENLSTSILDSFKWQ